MQSLCSSQMQCRFVVSILWDKHKDLISHECFGLEEKITSCKDESNFVVDSEWQSKVKAGFFRKYVEH